MEKAPDAFRTISEVAVDLDVPQHVLRFWESRFREIKPMKRGGGRRYYRPDDISLLRGIRQLLYGEGYTIRGVQRMLKEHGVKFVQTVWQEGAAQPQRLPEDEMEEAAEAAHEQAPTPRGLRGILPSLHSQETERREPRLDESRGAEMNPAAASASPASAGRAIAEDERRRLEAVLHELAECRRLLDDVLR